MVDTNYRDYDRKRRVFYLVGRASGDQPFCEVLRGPEGPGLRDKLKELRQDDPMGEYYIVGPSGWLHHHIRHPMIPGRPWRCQPTQDMAVPGQEGGIRLPVVFVRDDEAVWLRPRRRRRKQKQ